MKKFEIGNLKFEIAYGFTLIEVIVVIGVFVILSTIILSILVTIIRGSKKSDSVVSVRQDGEHAMDQIVRVLRFAKSLDPATTCDGATQLNNITITAVDLSQNTFTCPATSANPIKMNNTTNLTNSNISQVVVTPVNSCYFVCTQNTGRPPTIRINFNLSKVNSNGVLEGNTTIPFQSSVILRNIGN